MSWELIFNDESSNEYNVYPVDEKVSVPAPEKDISVIEVPGRDGALHVDNKRYKPIDIPIKLNFINYSNKIDENFRIIKKWLRGSGILSFSYDENYFYKVYDVKINNWSNTFRKGDFTAVFTCDPFTYSKLGTYAIKNPSKLYNDGYPAKPVYKITGEGYCLLNVNNSIVKVNIGQNCIIDTGLQIAYRDDGQIVNTSVTGDMSELCLNEGNNDISVSEGFDLYVIPNWRYL